MKIVTIHDVFRSAAFGLPELEESIAPWHHGLFGSPLTRLGHAVRRFSLMENGEPRKLIAAADRARRPRDPTTWAWLFSDPAARGVVAELLAPLNDADLVVGFEMTPNMIRVLAAAGRRFVEITQDPIRFCPDLFFRIRSNDPGIVARLAKWEVPDTVARAEADRLRGQIAVDYDGPEAVLYVGQVDIDSSLIAGASLTRVGPFVEQIAQTLRGRRLLLKPHPMTPKSADLLRLYARFPESRFIAGNIYALLASPAIRRVVTLSSSVAAEAPMFDKPVVRLITPDLHALSDVVSRFHRVDARATTQAFWGDVIDGMPSFMFLEGPPPPIRRRFSVTWGYTPEMTAPLSRRVAVDETISFAIGGRGLDFCLFGWSEPEPWGIWSDGAEAMLRFDPPDDCEIELVFMPFVPDAAHPLALTISSRTETEQHDIALTFHSGEATSITVAGRGATELLFRINDPISPRQLGLGDDARLLGVGLHRMTVRHTKGP